MKFSRIALAAIGVIVIIVIINLVFFTCDSGDEPTTTMFELAYLIPEEATTLTYFNMYEIEGDRNLQDIEKQWELEESEFLRDFGLEIEKIASILNLEINGKDLRIIQSRQSISKLRKSLKDLGYSSGDFGKEHNELWESPDETEWLSIIDDSIIAGNKEAVMSCIYVRDGASSLGNNTIAIEILDQLPQGIMMHLDRYKTNLSYNGLEMVGASIDKKNSEKLEANIVYRFNTAEQAEDVLDTLYYDIDAIYDKPEIEQNGRLLFIEAQIGINAIDIWDKNSLIP